MDRNRAAALYRGGSRLDVSRLVERAFADCESVKGFEVEEWPDGQVVVRVKVSFLRTLLEPRAISAAIDRVLAGLGKGDRVVFRF